MSEGRQSAFGYRFRSLATVERFLRFLREHLGELASIALHVEPTSLSRQGIARDDDIVDYAVELDTVITTAKPQQTTSDGYRAAARENFSLLAADHPLLAEIQQVGNKRVGHPAWHLRSGLGAVQQSALDEVQHSPSRKFDGCGARG